MCLRREVLGAALACTHTHNHVAYIDEDNSAFLITSSKRRARNIQSYRHFATYPLHIHVTPAVSYS